MQVALVYVRQCVDWWAASTRQDRITHQATMLLVLLSSQYMYLNMDLSQMN